MVISITPEMASQGTAVAAAQSHSRQANLDQERTTWFTTLEAYKRRFEAEKEDIKANFTRESQNSCRDLEEQARFIEQQNLPRPVLDLFHLYQAEIKNRRLAECDREYERSVKSLEAQEKELFRQHHLTFPLPTSSMSRSVAHAPPTVASSAAANRTPTPAQVQLQTQATQAVPPRPNGQASSNISSAPMPTQQNHQQWQAYGQLPSHHAPPHMQANMYQQNRPGVVTKAAETAPRTLPSNGRAPILGSGMSGPMQNPVSSHGLGGAGSPRLMSHPAEAGRGARVPIPPIHQQMQHPREDRPTMVRVGNGIHLSPGRQDEFARQLQADPHRQLKRKSDAGEISSYQEMDPKRPRTGTPQSMAPKTITFNEIYQDGKAEFKHTIVKFEDIFYILKCDEHGVHFKQNALAAAAKHLHGASHGHQKKEHRLAIRTIGFHVVDCTEELAKLNNDFVHKAFENGYKPLNQLHGPKSGGKRQSNHDMLGASPDPSPRGQAVLRQNPKEEFTDFITDFEAGELYWAIWPADRKMYPVMVLGWKDLARCGWHDMKFCDLKLYTDKQMRPACYIFDAEGIAGWAEGYRDGEPNVLARQAPVMWFENNGENRLGWLSARYLRPFLLDDPNRNTNPNSNESRARKLYASLRGFNSWEEMRARQLALQSQSPADPNTSAKVRSPESESDSASQDVDMYDFGDNPPKLDDSGDEDYVDTKKGRNDSDDEMADAEPATPQPLRRSTQEVRPTSRLSESMGLHRTGAAAGTRSSAKKDPVDADKDTDTAEVQGTPSKSRVIAEDKETTTPNNVSSNSRDIPQVALGTPATPKPDGVSKGAENDTSMVDAISARQLAEMAQSKLSEKRNMLEDPKVTAGRVAQRDGESSHDNRREKSLSVPANTANNNGERSGASKSPSLEKEFPKVSPKLQVANLLNSTVSDKAKGQPTPTNTSTPAEPRRPLPSEAGGAATVAKQSAPLRHPLPPKPSGQVQPSQQPADKSSQPEPRRDLSIEVQASPQLSVNGQGREGSKQPSPTEASRSVSVESTQRRSDPRMSISALDDKPTTPQPTAVNGNSIVVNGGTASGNSTPRLLTKNLDDRWRAVRASESPRITPASIRSPLVDRSAAASPVLGGKKELGGLSIDVASFSEGNRRWVGGGENMLHFHIEDEARGVARGNAKDGFAATVDAQKVKAAQHTKEAVRLVLKTEDGASLEQRFTFETNSLTGSSRSSGMQALKFYQWVTRKNEEIEHLG
ncbi:hypothetical protein GCG54_00007314 [Colletotrichum gloeosporioides]|uniref:Uncharacterized protein n=1 Tax=Colletotrichum gloeosporioides TaxID=474922 RepID=A0A8H4CN72_COLGL|nr:uncharacterized protein GCG54_00007314 [Colletotrichum gloeosporioides]KAF3807058.1 hypothetical protein GCG54_00007314 [Colletotrichum gloeosporioides]